MQAVQEVRSGIEWFESKEDEIWKRSWNQSRWFLYFQLGSKQCSWTKEKGPTFDFCSSFRIIWFFSFIFSRKGEFVRGVSAARNKIAPNSKYSPGSSPNYASNRNENQIKSTKYEKDLPMTMMWTNHVRGWTISSVHRVQLSMGNCHSAGDNNHLIFSVKFKQILHNV